MTVFSNFFKIAKKYLGNFIMYTCIFLGITITMTKTQQKDPVESFSETECKVAIFNHSDIPLAGHLVDYIDEHHKLVEIEESLKSFRDEMYIRSVQYIIVIPENFADTLEVQVYKMPGSFAATFLDMSVNSFITTYSAYTAGGMSPEEAYANTIATVEMETEIKINNETSAVDYPDEHFYFSYMPYILICTICLGIAPILIAFNKKELKNRILCSEMTLGKRNLQLALGCMVYTFGLVLIYVVVALILYGNAIFTTAGLLRILNAFTYSLVCISFAFMLSTLTEKVNVVNMFVNGIGLGSSFLCGVFVPREYLGKSVTALGRIFPAHWYVNVEEAVSRLSPSVTDDLITGYLVQLLFAAAFMVLALVVGSRRKAK